MFILRNQNGDYMLSLAGYLRPVTRDKATHYTKKEAQTYIDCGKLQGFIFIAEPV